MQTQRILNVAVMMDSMRICTAAARLTSRRSALTVWHEQHKRYDTKHM